MIASSLLLAGNGIKTAYSSFNLSAFIGGTSGVISVLAMMGLSCNMLNQLAALAGGMALFGVSAYEVLSEHHIHNIRRLGADLPNVLVGIIVLALAVMRIGVAIVKIARER